MRELLAAPGAWCQHAQQRDAHGLPLGIFPNEAAVSHCLIGAALKFRCCQSGRFISELIGPYWSEWNDAPGRTHLEVVEMLERAVLAAKKEEGET
jgi:hypothetical protein